MIWFLKTFFLHKKEFSGDIPDTNERNDSQGSGSNKFGSATLEETFKIFTFNLPEHRAADPEAPVAEQPCNTVQ